MHVPARKLATFKAFVESTADCPGSLNHPLVGSELTQAELHAHIMLADFEWYAIWTMVLLSAVQLMW